MYVDGFIDWRNIQTLARSMPDFHKTLILVNVKGTRKGTFVLEEVAIASEHAPFRHRLKKSVQVGSQVKVKTTNKKPKLGDP
jgi:hypothetical protein